MKAIRIHRFGGPEVLELDDVPIPQPGTGELLVRIGAASVNPVDYKIRRSTVTVGQSRNAADYPRP
jgi:NADPH:quinone reductase-like Zn-dependent oxidoreductase